MKSGRIQKRKNSVFGIFSDQSAMERAIDVLRAHHFRNSDISVLVPSVKNTKKNLAFKRHSKAPEGISTGVITGVSIGAIFGWLLGAGVLLIPGLNPIAEAGAVMGAIAGAGVGGTLGAIVGGLIGLGIPEYEAQRFEGYIKDGGMLLTVHVDDGKWEKRAKRILDDNGATNIATTFEKKLKTPTRKINRDFYPSRDTTTLNPDFESRVEMGNELNLH